MKRTLGLLLTAITSAALAQTPTVVEKPAAKAVAKAPTKSSAATVKSVKAVTVPVQKATSAPAAKPAVVAAKPAAAPAHSATVNAVAVPVAHANVSASTKPAAVPANPVAVAVSTAHVVQVSAKPAATPAHVAVVPANSQNLKAAPAKGDPFKKSESVRPPAKAVSRSMAPAPGRTSPGKSTGISAGTKSGVPATATAPPQAQDQAKVAVQDSKPVADSKTAKPISPANRRDPFVSPVVSASQGGSGCSSGKRCLAIDQVELKGIVKSDSGMIAVVVNALDKAYFLHENDPVFNGYVLKITGDSIVFKETFRDKLGKPLTRDVTKSISRPAV